MLVGRYAKLLDFLNNAIRPHKTGIVWAGPIFDLAGYGNVSRNFIRGLARLKIPLRVVQLGADQSSLLPADLTAELKSLTMGDAGPYPVEVIHYEPGSFASIRNVPEPSARIGCTIFETDRIPGYWVDACNNMDEIWVPSEFNRKTFRNSGVKPEKLRVVPYSVDTDFYRPITERYVIPGLRKFSFLYVSFWDWRKGFDLLIEAYIREFTASDDVSLVLRTNDPDPRVPKTSDDLRQLLLAGMSTNMQAAGAQLPHIALVTDALTQDDLRRLYNTCDVYISTDRANGWGMPCMEAMAMGKPAATIDWSGSTQFMTARNSLLIKPTGRLEPVDSRLVTSRPIYAGHHWAEVTVDEVRRVMRDAYESQDKLKDISMQATADIHRSHTLLRGGQRVHRAAWKAKMHTRRLLIGKRLGLSR